MTGLNINNNAASAAQCNGFNKYDVLVVVSTRTYNDKYT